jgi:tetratricopeptide (TPR) repeat protein
MKLRKIISLIVTIVAVLTVGSTTFAFSSKEKTPEEQAAEKEKKATEAYNDGVKHMDKAKQIAHDGDSTYAFNYRATSSAKAKKEYEKAVKDLTTAVELKPDFAEAHNNLGYCYRKLDKLLLSLESYHQALELKPGFPEAHEYLGETYLAMDSLDLAKGQFQMLQELKSPYADTLLKSIELYKLAKVNEKLNGTKR